MRNLLATSSREDQLTPPVTMERRNDNLDEAAVLVEAARGALATGSRRTKGGPRKATGGESS